MIRRIHRFIQEKGWRKFVQAIVRKLNAIWFKPSIDVCLDTSGLIYLGSAGCGKTFQAKEDLRGSTIVSCGLGEDGSFDVDFASRYGARVIIVDPTPRAITHFRKIVERIGSPAETAYTNSGEQDVRAYDLASIDLPQLELVEKAIWIDDSDVTLYAPVNPNHVSHSITNFQRNYDTQGDYPHIVVKAVSLPQLLTQFGISELPLLKLDVEGAEVELVPSMLRAGIRPNQLLIEIDGLNRPCARAKADAEMLDNLLKQNGYQCLHHDGVADFLYVRKS